MNIDKYKKAQKDLNKLMEMPHIEKWVKYFQTMDMELLIEPSQFGDYTPTFYLPDYLTFVDIHAANELQSAQAAMDLVQDKLFKVVYIMEDPSFNHYECLFPIKNGKEFRVENVNMVQDPDQPKGTLITGEHLQGKAAYKERGLDKAIRAVEAANS